MLPLAAACAMALVIIWIGYPLLIAAVAAVRGRPASAEMASSKRVSVVIASRDDPSLVQARVNDVLRGEYPLERLEIVVGLDGAGTATPASMGIADPRVRVVTGSLPGGKATALNAAVEASQGEILVFTDTAQRFAPRTIGLLCSALREPRLGAVSGALHVGGAVARPTLADRYWAFERWLRANEAIVHSTVGVTGAVYAMRRECWRPLPAGVILDDVYAPMDLVLRGWRVGFVPEATAFDDRHFPPALELRRKTRTLTGVIQLCMWRPEVLLPWRNPIWLQFVFHKLLRLATPYLLAVGGVALVLGGAATVAASTSSQVVLLVAIAAMGGIVLLAVSRRLREGIGMAIAMQAAVVRATVNGLRGRWDVWSR